MIYLNHTETQEDVSLETELTGKSAIILFNDDVNTFDHVIDCLVTYCEHTEEQAEQCALIVHYKGKCAVKHGSFDELHPVCDALCHKGLSAVVENLEN